MQRRFNPQKVRLIEKGKLPGQQSRGPPIAYDVMDGNGEDMLLIPGDLDGAANGLLKAVKSGEIPQAQFRKWIDGALTQPKDRQLFDL